MDFKYNSCNSHSFGIVYIVATSFQVGNNGDMVWSYESSVNKTKEFYACSLVTVVQHSLTATQNDFIK